jgi:hypothetical protein
MSNALAATRSAEGMFHSGSGRNQIREQSRRRRGKAEPDEFRKTKSTLAAPRIQQEVDGEESVADRGPQQAHDHVTLEPGIGQYAVEPGDHRETADNVDQWIWSGDSTRDRLDTTQGIQLEIPSPACFLRDVRSSAPSWLMNVR